MNIRMSSAKPPVGNATAMPVKAHTPKHAAKEANHTSPSRECGVSRRLLIIHRAQAQTRYLKR